MNLANKISIIRILLVPFFVGSILYYRPEKDILRLVALSLFVIGILTDAADGCIARITRQKTRLGTYLDPLADKLLIVGGFICLSFGNSLPANLKLPLWVSLTVVSRDGIIFLGAMMIYIIRGNLEVAPSRLGKVTTFLQMATIVSVLLKWPNSYFIWNLAVIFTLASGIGYIRRGTRLLNTGQMISLVFALIISYLIGSIPTAFILGKLLKGIDIRKYGSGNVGATNAIRVMGRTIGLIVLLIDIAKGTASVTLVADLFLGFPMPLSDILFRVLLGLAAISGHCWMLFLKFKGGKGLATGLGILAGLSIKIGSLRPVLVICLGIWVLVVIITRYVSMGSIISSISMPVLMLIIPQTLEITLLGIMCCLVVVYRHKSNIKRLLRGEESQISFVAFGPVTKKEK